MGAATTNEHEGTRIGREKLRNGERTESPRITRMTQMKKLRNEAIGRPTVIPRNGQKDGVRKCQTKPLEISNFRLSKAG